MGFKCGIVGLPNVGKSTLFNALTASKNAEAANFPFCTIDPNIGVVDVMDERLDQLSKLSNSKKKIYTNITFVDIAEVQEEIEKLRSQGWNIVSVYHGEVYNSMILEKFNPKKGCAYIPARKKIKIL